MISPTIGRVVLFHPAGSDPAAEPYPALVAKVWNDKMINVGGFNDAGTPFGATSVTLLQDDDAPPAAGPWAEWMPYQKGQAAKYEQLAAEVGETPKANPPA